MTYIQNYPAAGLGTNLGRKLKRKRRVHNHLGLPESSHVENDSDDNLNDVRIKNTKESDDDDDDGLLGLPSTI